MMRIIGSVFVGNTDRYCTEDSLKTGEELFEKIQEETNALRQIPNRNMRLS